jgi:hypothetical protein
MAASAFDLPLDKRDNKRSRLLLTARMECDYGTIEVHLLNISHSGAKLDAERAPMRGETVTLIHGELKVTGTVAWVEETRFGMAFDHSIDARFLVDQGQHHLNG